MDGRWKIFRVVGLGLGVALRKIVLWQTDAAGTAAD